METSSPHLQYLRASWPPSRGRHRLARGATVLSSRMRSLDEIAQDEVN